MAFSATFIYEILDKYSPVLRKISSVTDTFRLKSMYAGQALKTMGSKISGVSTGLANLRTMVAAVGFTRGFKNVTNSAFEFQKSMNAVEARTFGTRLEMKKLEKQALSLGASTIFTSKQVADGMKFLAQTGFETNQIFSLMPRMLTLAAAGDLQLAEAADIATNVLKTFGLEIGEMGRVADVLALAASSSNTDIRQLAGAIRNVGAVAKGVGVEIEEVAALIGVLGDKGIQAGQAGTLLMNAFRVLATEAPKVRKGLMNFGLKRKDVMTKSGELKDFTGLLQVLGDKGATVGQLFDIFSIRGGKAVMALKDSAMSVRELNVALMEAKGTSKKMAEIMLKYGVGNIIKMQSAFDNMKISIGMALMPMAIILADIATKVSQFVSKQPKLAKFIGLFLLIGSALTVIVVGLGVMGAVVGGLTTLFGTLGITIGVAFWPVTLVVLAIVAVIAVTLLLYKRFENIRKLISIIAGFAKNRLAGRFKIVWMVIREIGKMILEKFLRPFKLLDDILGVVFDGTTSWSEKLKAIGKLILDFILAPFRKVMELFDKIKSPFKGVNKDFNIKESSEILTSNAASPSELAAGSQKTIVEVIHKGAIDINDKTGRASIAGGGDGGNVPMNLDSIMGYQY